MSDGQDWAQTLADICDGNGSEAVPDTPELRTLVYLAGPITLGDRDTNFGLFAAMQRLLMRNGLAVINPGLTMKLPYAWDIPHADWMANSLPQVQAADAVLRLPGESRGADEEVRFAISVGIPVFTDWEELVEWSRE